MEKETVWDSAEQTSEVGGSASQQRDQWHMSHRKPAQPRPPWALWLERQVGGCGGRPPSAWAHASEEEVSRGNTKFRDLP